MVRQSTMVKTISAGHIFLCQVFYVVTPYIFTIALSLKERIVNHIQSSRK